MKRNGRLNGLVKRNCIRNKIEWNRRTNKLSKRNCINFKEYIQNEAAEEKKENEVKQKNKQTCGLSVGVELYQFQREKN